MWVVYSALALLRRTLVRDLHRRGALAVGPRRLVDERLEVMTDVPLPPVAASGKHEEIVLLLVGTPFTVVGAPETSFPHDAAAQQTPA
jgi:hypothetical protein